MPFAKTDPSTEPDLAKHIESVLSASETAPDGRATKGTGVSEPLPKDEGESEEASSGERTRARGIIRDIGAEFNKLRKRGRSAAWADLEDKVAAAGDILIATGMISFRDWTGMMIDIEQFRKAEGGSEELPGDALAKWLSEPEKKAKAKAAN
jgi:hypothetical protein